MPIDPSIYAQQNPVDPLGSIQKMVDTSTGIATNALTRMDVQKKILLGKAIQAATRPDGTIDVNKINTFMAAPGNSIAAPEAAKTSLDLQAQELANTTAAQGVSTNAVTALGTAWGARLARTAGPLDPKDLQKDIIDLSIRGQIPSDMALKLIRAIPDDPAAARSYAAGGYLQALGPAATAAPAAAPPGPGGVPRAQTTGEFVTQSLGGEAPAAGGDVSAMPAATTTPPTRGVVTGLNPSVAAALPAAAANAATAGNTLVNMTADVPNQKAALDNMLQDQTEFTAGPMSDTITNLTASVNELFGTKIDLTDVAAKERFDKVANQIALAQSGALGVTDLTTRTAMGANPHSGMSNLGIVGNIALLKGNADALEAKGTAWQKYLQSGGTPDQYFAWSSSFNKMFDPRVFQSVYLDPDQRKKVYDAIPSAREKDAFRTKYNYAVQQGWIPDPRSP